MPIFVFGFFSSFFITCLGPACVRECVLADNSASSILYIFYLQVMIQQDLGVRRITGQAIVNLMGSERHAYHPA
ncbi:hypothetical protein BZA05DRAFT_269106 [Tricharina praecox]|uniref:uncharacterized protein n=1 Tax=Tricharina praecox TaxID=43433 RepID=UPI00221EC1ED|nr:uncharacterized protein BZA05DRAFT_269106 [Tricharina praecox]KAI5853756.1 hypothetical protein BZA05DRAFT_269106 [Tricharina praecox]